MLGSGSEGTERAGQEAFKPRYVQLLGIRY